MFKKNANFTNKMTGLLYRKKIEANMNERKWKFSETKYIYSDLEKPFNIRGDKYKLSSRNSLTENTPPRKKSEIVILD